MSACTRLKRFEIAQPNQSEISENRRKTNTHKNSSDTKMTKPDSDALLGASEHLIFLAKDMKLLNMSMQLKVVITNVHKATVQTSLTLASS